MISKLKEITMIVEREEDFQNLCINKLSEIENIEELLSDSYYKLLLLSCLIDE